MIYPGFTPAQSRQLVSAVKKNIRKNVAVNGATVQTVELAIRVLFPMVQPADFTGFISVLFDKKREMYLA